MKFEFAKSFPSQQNKMKELESFLENLSDEYPDEFNKEKYDNGSRILGLGQFANGVMKYSIHDELPEHIQTSIENKLKELWPV